MFKKLTRGYLVQGGNFIPPIWRDYVPPRIFDATNAGTIVTDMTTLALPAAWRAVNLIGDSIAGLPMRAYRAEQMVSPTPPLLKQPNANESRYETIFSSIVSLLLRGNCYWMLGDFDKAMRPQQVLVLHPDDIRVERDRETGDPVYKIRGEQVDAAFIKHIRGFTMPGTMTGLGVVAANREALAHGQALAEFSQRHFTEAAVPPIAITTDAELDEDGQERMRQLQEQWVINHGRSRRPAVLYGGMDVKPLGFSPEDSQFLESRQFSVHEIANMFGVPPHFLGVSDSQVYTSSAWEAMNFAKFTLRPWIVRIELALSDLFARGTEVQFDMDSILRADQGTRFANYALALGGTRNVGWITVDEVRAIEGYAPLPPATEEPEDPQSPLADEDIDDDDAPEGDDTGPGAVDPYKPTPPGASGGAAAQPPKNPGVGR